MRPRLPALALLTIAVSFAFTLSNCGGNGASSSGGNGGGTSNNHPAPDFAFTTSMDSVIVPPGGALYFEVSVASKNSFSGSVSVNVTGVPAGATFLPGTSFSMTADSYQGLSLILPSSAQGTLTLSFQGTSGTLQHSTSISITIQQQPLASFSLFFNGTTEMTLTQGSSVDSAIGVSITSGDNPYYDRSAFSDRAAIGRAGNLCSEPVSGLGTSFFLHSHSKL